MSHLPGAQVTGSYDPHYVCWKLNSGPLREQYELLSPEPRLQPSYPTLYLGSGESTQVLKLLQQTLTESSPGLLLRVLNNAFPWVAGSLQSFLGTFPITSVV